MCEPLRVESSVVPSAANSAATATAGILKKEVRFEEAGKSRKKKKGKGDGKGKPSELTKPELEEKRKGAKLHSCELVRDEIQRQRRLPVSYGGEYLRTFGSHDA